MIPCLLTATSVFIIAFVAAPPVDIDGIREPVSGSLLYGNNIISGAVVPTSNAIGLHFYPIWEAASLDEWLYNGGPYQLIVCHFLLGVCCYMGREWELSFRLGMRPWIAVAYSAPVAAASAVFLVYPIGQGSFSDGMPLGKAQFAHNNGNIVNRTLLNGESLSSSNPSLYNRRSLTIFVGPIVKALNPFLGLLNQVNQTRNVVCTAIGNTTSGGEPNKPENDFDAAVVQRGLDCLDNPVLRGSFSLVLSQDRLIFLEQVAKNAWTEITSRGLRDESQLLGATSTVKLKDCPSNVVFKNHGGVYVILNLENGRAVIGQTKNLASRFNQYTSRASRSDIKQGDNINRAYFQDAQEFKTRTGKESSFLFQRYVAYSWLDRDLSEIDLKNEMSYLEHRLILAFYVCGLAYNTVDSAPQLNPFVELDSSSSVEEEKPQPVGGNKATKPFKFNGVYFRSMGDLLAYRDQRNESRGNKSRLRAKLTNNANNRESNTRYLTEEEIRYCNENNLFVVVERTSSPYKPKPNLEQ